MDSRDREAISELFRKLQDVERQAGPRDAEAERLIADEARRVPGAPYYMAQTIVMQDMALQAKQQEVEELKRRIEQPRNEGGAGAAGGGFLSRVFGGGAEPSTEREPAGSRGGPWGAPRQAVQPGYGQPPQYPPQQGGGFGGGGGGFLAGAAQTAMGVAGGVVLGNAIGSMFGGQGGLFGGGGAAQQPTEVVNETTNIYEGDANGGAQGENVADQGADANDGGYQDASYDDGGGDAGDAGGYDDV